MTENTGEAGGAHYRIGKIQPWDLTRNMQTSGNAHVDSCRCAIIKYGFRKKGDIAKMIDDLRKAAHYAEEAAQCLERELMDRNQPELPFGKTLKHINGHRCEFMPPGPFEGLAVCVDCKKAEGELDEPCRATNGGGS